MRFIDLLVDLRVRVRLVYRCPHVDLLPARALVVKSTSTS